MPKGHHNRIVKPRSARQREHAEDYTNRAENVIAIVPSTAGLPDRSWWLGLSREDFDAAVAEQAGRMRDSKIGRAHGNGNLTERNGS